VIVGLRGPGYDSGSGLAPLLRNRDKRYLLYLMACLLSGEVVLPRAYDTDIYLTAWGCCSRRSTSSGSSPGLERRVLRVGIGSFAVLALCLLG
jgi:hypothetical protein